MGRVIYSPTVYLRRDKQGKDGKCPVYVRFQRINGKEPKYSLGISVSECEWNEGNKRPKDMALKIIVDNKISVIETQILNSIANGIEITTAILKEFVTGKDKPELRSFYEYFDEYLLKRVKGGKREESTLKGYKSTRNALKEYRPEFRVADINTNFLEGFDKFLIKRGNNKGKGDVKGSRSNRIKHVNAVLNYIERQGISVHNPYKRGELDVPQADINDVFLDFEELGKLVALMYKLEPGTKEYRVLCMFLFSCATGLRVGDTLDLKWGNIDFDASDEYVFLDVDTRKTKAYIDAPISELGKDMLEFSVENDIEDIDHEKLIFHRISGYNYILKKLANTVGIHKNISHNCSRRTFITLLKAQGVDDYSVMKMAGHKNSHTTHRYMKWNKSLALNAVSNMELFKLKDLLRGNNDRKTT